MVGEKSADLEILGGGSGKGGYGALVVEGGIGGSFETAEEDGSKGRVVLE